MLQLQQAFQSIKGRLETLKLGSSLSVYDYIYDDNGTLLKDEDTGRPLLEQTIYNGFLDTVGVFSSTINAAFKLEFENTIGVGILYRGGTSRPYARDTSVSAPMPKYSETGYLTKELDSRCKYIHHATFTLVVWFGGVLDIEQKMIEGHTGDPATAVVNMLEVVRRTVDGLHPCQRSGPLRWVSTSQQTYSSNQQQTNGTVYYNLNFEVDIYVIESDTRPETNITNTEVALHPQSIFRTVVVDLNIGANKTLGDDPLEVKLTS